MTFFFYFYKGSLEIISITFAIQGPKYNTNVCKPVPSPIDDAIPNINQYAQKYPIS